MAGHMYNGRETELLIPASSLEVLKIAVIFGADAVYIGGEAFGLRAKAKNFSIEDMKEGVKSPMKEMLRFMLQLISWHITMTLRVQELTLRSLRKWVLMHLLYLIRECSQ